MRGKENGEFKRVVFIAGGVGINPLMSMVSFIGGEKVNGRLEGVKEVRFLYSTKEEGSGEQVLFLSRLVYFYRVLEGELSLFLTGSTMGKEEDIEVSNQMIRAKRRRILEEDLLEALGPVEDRANTVCYICGVPTMTDEFIEKARKAEGMLEENVLFEKWW